ncbi:unnamed protein product [Rhodiola kirilowii]
MYEERDNGESYTNDVFIAGVNQFIQTAESNGVIDNNNKIRCPCMRCKNRRFIHKRMMEEHLYKYGFTPDSFHWTLHGEDLVETDYINNYYIIPHPITDPVFDYEEQNENHDEAPSRNIVHESHADIPESSNSDPAYEGCTTETQLSINMKMLATKASYGLSEGAFNAVCGMMKNLIGGGENNIPSSFRQSKKLVAYLGMGYQWIDVCVRGCMIYYGCDESITACCICSEPRYHHPRHTESSSSYQRNARCQMFYLPIIPRLQRLFLSEYLAREMCWHATPRTDVHRMVHPSDGES